MTVRSKADIRDLDAWYRANEIALDDLFRTLDLRWDRLTFEQRAKLRDDVEGRPETGAEPSRSRSVPMPRVYAPLLPCFIDGRSYTSEQFTLHAARRRLATRLASLAREAEGLAHRVHGRSNRHRLRMKWKGA